MAATMNEDLSRLRDQLREFASERDWDQFHSPKNLAMALIVEAAELVEHFQWLTEEQSRQIIDSKRSEIEDEIADIYIYLIRLADKLGIDLSLATKNKIKKNQQKYPADKVKGSARKYTDYVK